MSTSTLPTINENSLEPLKQTEEQRRSGKFLSAKMADTCLDWVVFPALLFVQFGATMYCQARQGLLELDWVVVLTTILFFCIIAGVYRQIFRRHPWESLFLLLLPEIFTNVLLAFVMFGKIVAAFKVLVVLTGVLLVLGTMAAFHIYCTTNSSSPAPEDYQALASSEHDNGDDTNPEDQWIC